MAIAGLAKHNLENSTKLGNIWEEKRREDGIREEKIREEKMG